MGEEAGVEAEADVVVGAESAHGDRGDRAGAGGPEVTDQVQPGAVGQFDVAEQKVKRGGFGGLDPVGERGGRTDAMAALAEQEREVKQGIFVVFNDHDVKPFARLGRRDRAARRVGLCRRGDGRQIDGERRAEIATGA